MLWLWQTGFGVYFGRGLRQWTYSAGFSQIVAAHESCQSPRNFWRLYSWLYFPEDNSTTNDTQSTLRFLNLSLRQPWCSWKPENGFGWSFAGPARNSNMRIVRGQRGFCERKYTWAPGGIFADVMKDHEHARPRRCNGVSNRLHLLARLKLQANFGIIQVEMLCSRQSIEEHLTKGAFRWWDGWPTLLMWSIWNPSQSAQAATKLNKLFTSHSTVERFYAETTRKELFNGKRSLEIWCGRGGQDRTTQGLR